MSAFDPRIEHLLAVLKSDGRSSPSDWHQFYLFLQGMKLPEQQPPPVPLILAASSESNATKHDRLRRQLEWALVNSCLDEAITYLEKVPIDQWNSCPLKDWDKDSYPK
jgi:hypothetical protein